MGPVFTDLPLVKDGDEIGILNGGQAVGYDQHGPSFHQAVQRLLHQVLILSIQGTVTDKATHRRKQRSRSCLHAYTRCHDALPPGHTHTHKIH